MYKTDDDGAEFESDRRFSNFILLIGTLALGGILMFSNVMHQRRQQAKVDRQKEN
jgi:protein SCO1